MGFEIVTEERERRLFAHESANIMNNLEYQPILFDMGNPDELAQYDAFCKRHPDSVYFDSMLCNLVELYKRFHPKSKLLPQDSYASKEFRNWLIEESFTPPYLEKTQRLLIPHGFNGKGDMVWDIISVLPKNLQRKLQEASAWKLMDSPDGNIKTREILHNDIDLIVIGTSVGSNIASTLVPALGVEHVTLVDGDIQDATGSARIDDPRVTAHGKYKVLRLRDSLFLASPYIKCRALPVPVDPNNIDRILDGTMPENPQRKVVIIEEVDNPFIKDLIRDRVRKKYPQNGQAVIISVADIGRAAIKMVAEEPEDPHYMGLAYDHSKSSGGEDASRLEPDTETNIKRIIVAKIMATYGLATKGKRYPKSGDVKIPPELSQALDDLFAGNIASFEQSGLSSRMAGVVVGQTLLSWIEGNLETKILDFDLSKLLDSRWQDTEFIEASYQKARQLQKNLGLKFRRKKG